MTMKHPVPPAILQAIGDITVSFALLELHMQRFVQIVFASESRVSNLAVTFLSFKNLIPFLEGMFLDKYGSVHEQYGYLRAMLIRARRLEELRNQITHSVWGSGPDEQSVSRIKVTCREKKGLRMDMHHVAGPDLVAIAVEMRDLANEFYFFACQLKGESVEAVSKSSSEDA